MKKRASFLASALALVFGSTQGQASPIARNSPVVASETPQKRERPERLTRAEQRATRQSERNDAVFREYRITREQWCAIGDALLAEDVVSQRGLGTMRVSAKERRRVQRWLDRKRHPEAFES